MITEILGKKTPTKDAKYTEHSLSVNEFGQPSVLTDQYAVPVKLIELLLLNPGTYPTKPDMGVGLIRNYRYTFMDNLQDLQTEIENQISTYLPEFTSVEVRLYTEDPTKQLLIGISVDDSAYTLVLDQEKKTLDVL